MKIKFETPELELHRFSVDEAILLLSGIDSGDGSRGDFDMLFPDAAITQRN